jgi:hypothetical protein
VEENFIDVFFENEDALIVGLLVLVGLGLCRLLGLGGLGGLRSLRRSFFLSSRRRLRQRCPCKD